MEDFRSKIICESYRHSEETACVIRRKPKETVFWKANDEVHKGKRWCVMCWLWMECSEDRDETTGSVNVSRSFVTLIREVFV